MDDLHQGGRRDFSNPVFENIDITDDFMFSTVMQDAGLCKDLLGCLMPELNIGTIRCYRYAGDGSEILVPDSWQDFYSETQKSLSFYADSRSVRLDAYLEDDGGVYDIEMQTSADKALAQRCRLYQSHMDISQLRRGQPYDRLRPGYVIFICKYDPFGEGLYRYTFRNMCDEKSGLALGDGAYKVFFNTAGHVGEVPPGLAELLRYMNNTRDYPVGESGNDLIRRIERAVNTAKMDEKWRNSYMIYQMKQREAEIRGEERGEERGEKRGRNDERIAIASKMLRDSMPAELIAKYSGLSASEIGKLKGQLTN